jgi:hypothetical protein
VREVVGRLATVAAGLPAEKIALIIAVGLVLGTFPVLGCATVLCALAAPAFRLNPVVLQLMNQIVTPAQYALVLPFARLGSRMIGSVSGLGGAVIDAVAGWFCISVPLGIVLYLALLYLLRARTQVLKTLETAV